jgi:hypothetical protein
MTWASRRLHPIETRRWREVRRGPPAWEVGIEELLEECEVVWFGRESEVSVVE